MLEIVSKNLDDWIISNEGFGYGKQSCFLNDRLRLSKPKKIIRMGHCDAYRPQYSVLSP